MEHAWKGYTFPDSPLNTTNPVSDMVFSYGISRSIHIELFSFGKFLAQRVPKGNAGFSYSG